MKIPNLEVLREAGRMKKVLCESAGKVAEEEEKGRGRRTWLFRTSDPR